MRLKQFKDFLGKKPVKKIKDYVKDPSLVEDIKQICMPLLDNGFTFQEEFISEANEYVFSFLGGIFPMSFNYMAPGQSIDSVPETQESIDENIGILEQFVKEMKTITDNLPELNDRLFEYSDEWNLSFNTGATKGKRVIFQFSMMKKRN